MRGGDPAFGLLVVGCVACVRRPQARMRRVVGAYQCGPSPYCASLKGLAPTWEALICSAPCKGAMMRSGDTAVGVLGEIRDTAINVILRPAAFFQTMPRRGGFRTPYVFLLVIGLVDMLLLSLFEALAVGPKAGLAFAVHALVLAPLALTLSGFVLATVFFVFWRLMGSSQSYETAYRTFAYSYAISPVTTIIGFVPYLTLVGLFWWFALLVVASVYVHGIGRLKAAAVFATLGLAMAIFVTRAEHYVMRHSLMHPVAHVGRPARSTHIPPLVHLTPSRAAPGRVTPFPAPGRVGGEPGANQVSL